MFDTYQIKRQTESDFEKTWIESALFLPRNTSISIKKERGKSHPLRDLMEKFRQVFLELGFDEAENRTILPERDVYRQYGPEAPVILDRSFYLSKIPRPDIGLGNERIEQIKSIIDEFDIETLKTILRDYKKGKIEGDDFVEELATKLNIKAEQATTILDKVFSEFKKQIPKPTDLTLRSHMTATWYHTLAALQDKSDFPLALFSNGPRYRNEQKEDSGHLRVHHSASIVIMDPQMSIEAGQEITKQILKRFGFTDVEFQDKPTTSKYYAHNQEQEVFAKYNGELIEIANIGMYSVISLANFGIKYPVFNVGFGIERMAMILNKHKDIRELIFPQFTFEDFTDEQIAKSITYINQPKTEKGIKIAETIELTAKMHKDDLSPIEIMAYKDENITIKIVEKEEGKKLLGPAALNEIYVKDQFIKAKPEPAEVKTNITFINAIAKDIGYQIENNNIQNFKIKIIKTLGNINLTLPKPVSSFLVANNKKTDIYGPVFLEIEISPNSP